MRAATRQAPNPQLILPRYKQGPVMKMLQQEIAQALPREETKGGKCISVLLVLVEKDASVHTTTSVCFPNCILDIDSLADECEDIDVFSEG